MDQSGAFDPARGELSAGIIATPLGDLGAVVDAAGRVLGLDFLDTAAFAGITRERLTWRGEDVRCHDGLVAPIADQLASYFAGRLHMFTLPLAPRGNDFHQRVWAELLRIPYGQTLSYGGLAGRIGRPGAARAVGRANGSNPIAIIVPCHRVVGANGALTGYAGGIERKRALLALEHSTAPNGQQTLMW